MSALHRAEPGREPGLPTSPRGFTSCHPKSRIVRKKADQPSGPNRPGVRGVRDRPTDSWRRRSQRLPNMCNKVLPEVPCRRGSAFVRRVGSSTRRVGFCATGHVNGGGKQRGGNLSEPGSRPQT
eukprot:scaffold7181_cov48-Phaeocystis_antarctica.AAC.1